MEKIDSFSKRLKYIMNLKGVKSSHLSLKSGVDKSLISHYLSGDYKAKQDKVSMLAEALGVNELWLMGYDVEMENNLSNISTTKLTASEFEQEVKKLIGNAIIDENKKETMIRVLEMVCDSDKK